MRDFGPNEIPRFPARLFSLFFVDKKRGKRIKTNQQTLEISGIFRFVFIIVYGHSNATALIQAGVSPKVVQQRLGHSDITITLNTYTHVLPSMDKEAAAKIDDLIFSKTSSGKS